MSKGLSGPEQLSKRLRYLWTWELFDSFFVPGAVIVTVRIAHSYVKTF